MSLPPGSQAAPLPSQPEGASPERGVWGTAGGLWGQWRERFPPLGEGGGPFPGGCRLKTGALGLRNCYRPGARGAGLVDWRLRAVRAASFFKLVGNLGFGANSWDV